MESIPHVKNTIKYLKFPAEDISTPGSFKSGLLDANFTKSAKYKDGAGAWTNYSLTATISEIASIGVYEITLPAELMNHDYVLVVFSDITNDGAATAFGFSTTTYPDIILELLSKVGFTVGGVWTYQKLMKCLAAFFIGDWRDKSGSPGIKEILDPDDGTTVVMELTPSETTPYKSVTVLI